MMTIMTMTRHFHDLTTDLRSVQFKPAHLVDRNAAKTAAAIFNGMCLEHVQSEHSETSVLMVQFLRRKLLLIPNFFFQLMGLGWRVGEKVICHRYGVREERESRGCNEAVIHSGTVVLWAALEEVRKGGAIS